MACEFCLREVDTMPTELKYSVGLLFTHIEGGEEQQLCKRCLRTAFWVCQPINLTLGLLSFDDLSRTGEMIRENFRTYGASMRMSDSRRSQRPPALEPESTSVSPSGA